MKKKTCLVSLFYMDRLIEGWVGEGMTGWVGVGGWIAYGCIDAGELILHTAKIIQMWVTC